MPKLISFEEFRKKQQQAHSCQKCQGKIFCISIDKLGQTRCAYCNEIVNYPRATKEDLDRWMKEKGL